VKRLLLALGLAGSLTACGTTTPAPTPKIAAEIQAGADFNDTDVMFLQMLAHHQKQGLEMTATAGERARLPELKVLAAAVAATEQDELAMMRSWLGQWHRATEVDPNTSLHADHGGLPGTGPEEIKALRTARGADFDKAFLNLFLAHQHNAIEMALRETANGQNAAAKAFAARVRDSRQGEIQQMLKLVNSVG
jgi:uncharacterized protein (DUF305 family)